MPRKPQRKPKPRASDVSGSKVKLASLSESFCSAVRRSSNWLWVAGKRPQKTTGHGLLVTGQGLEGRGAGVGDGVADPDVGEALDIGDDVADLPDPQLVAGDGVGAEPAEPLDLVLGLAGHQADLLAALDAAVDDADVGDHALVVVELRVEDQRPERGVDLPRGGRDALDQGPEQLGDALAGLAADGEDLGAIDAEGLLDLLLDLVGPRRLHVDLVQRRQDRQVGVDRRVGVGDGLGLDPLSGVDQQDGPLASGEAARDLVVEIDVAGRVDQVQLVGLAVERVVDGDGAGLDGDATLAFQVHVVEQLLAELALRDRPRLEQELVGQRALAMVNVCDDREVTDEFRVQRHKRGSKKGIRQACRGPRWRRAAHCGRVLFREGATASRGKSLRFSAIGGGGMGRWHRSWDGLPRPGLGSGGLPSMWKLGRPGSRSHAAPDSRAQERGQGV